ncbi:uncharacterized protein LOC115376611 [Myripristis murdjan]|uniref:Uncharacterized LOC115376611 n=1 Tax=Myripristis murdjan TaxID=586833 RepID=A0A667YL39_9TELE|nr:uncharacterized protein LOC115376611 [Myripristis murdjan]
MAIFREYEEFTDARMVQKVVDLFEKNPPFQRIVQLGLLGIDMDNDLDIPSDDDIANHLWGPRRGSYHGFSGLSDTINRRLIGNPANSVYMPPLHRYTSSGHELPHLSSIPTEPIESHAERRARVLQGAKKSKEKTEKKRIKKQRQKERKRLEKEKQNPQKSDEAKDDSKKSKEEESKEDNQKSTKNDTSFSVKQLTPTKDSESDSSEEESSEDDSEPGSDSDDSEVLDLTSTFVSKAALIAKRKMEQKPRPERREKKKTPAREETQPATDKPNEDQNDVNKNTDTPSNPTVEDNIKISQELAMLGNKFASTGEFDMAVKYFTDAIKYNPQEFKLFGNRSFCFEKMQQYEKALTDAQLSLSMYPGWVKGLYRKGRALAGLKRYEEAAQAFKEVLKLDSSRTDAAQELMRVQISQLMRYGFSQEQSSNALIIHGTVNEALEVLSKLNCTSGDRSKDSHPARSPLPPASVENITRASPLPSANPNGHHPLPPPLPPQSQDTPKTPLKSKPLGPVQNMSNVHSQPQPIPNQAVRTYFEDRTKPELFPVWVGNVVQTVTEPMITDLFSSAGVIHSVKLLTGKRCAFINFTSQDQCDEAIRQFNGHELMGTKLIVRYPDRIPSGMGMSKSALKADYLNEEKFRQGFEWRNGGGSRGPGRPYGHVPNHRGDLKNKGPRSFPVHDNYLQ